MWCYHKPGFEARLLAELQRQQQCSQYCDTLLKADGVTVPVHSCVLSAVSPQVSFALSSMPVPPAGQRRLLEFGSFGADTLLHVVRLLYSGEMAGQCDREKQEAVSAAAMLGIHGLVEVTGRDPASRDGAGGGRRAEVGVQTEPRVPEESGAGQGIWRREARDGSILLWKEVLPEGQEDTGTQATQTEEPDISTALPIHPTASLSTIDASALHSLGQTDSHFVHSQVPYAPVSLVYRTDNSETAAPHPQPTASIESAGPPSYSSAPPSVNLLPNQMTLCSADPPGADRDVPAGEDWGGERLEQFQDNIPGFINYFLNPDKEEGSHCGRAGKRRRPRVRGGRSSAGESRPRERRRGRLTEIVEVQDVGVSRLQKLFLQKGGRGPPKPGQGGGAVGRRLCVKTRELLKRAKRGQQYSTEWDVSQSEKMLTFTERGQGRRVSKQSGGRHTEQQPKQSIPPAGSARKARVKPATSSLSSSSASNPSRRLFSSPRLRSPAAAGSPPAASPLHPSSLSPPAAPAQEGPPEHIDLLLEEVMMGLDILSSNNADPRAEPADQNSFKSLRSMCASSQSNLTQNKQDPSTEMESRPPGVRGPPPAGAAAGSREVLHVQQEEGELTDILDHFLQSFEHHICDCDAGDKPEAAGRSSASAGQPYSAQPHSRTRRTCRLQPATSSHTAALQQSVRAGEQSRRSMTDVTIARGGALPKRRGRPPGKARSSGRQRQRKRRGTRKHVSSPKKRKTTSESLRTGMYHEQDKQLQQRPVVRLERGDALLVKAKLSQEESPTHTEMGRKLYPIRNRLQTANVEGPSLHKPGDQGWKSNSNGLLCASSNGEVPAPQIQPERRREGQGDVSAAQPQDELEAARIRGQKRRAASEEAAGDEASVLKKVCAEQTETNVDDVVDVETVSASGAGDGLQRGGGAGNGPWSQTPLSETRDRSAEECDSDEIISVDGVTDLERKDDWVGVRCQSRAQAPPLESGRRASLGSTGGSEDEDINVIGGSSPLNAAANVSWAESPERGGGDEGDEDVDVV
ncbi:uncharacterized protein LOC114864507 [Betta splendens]|uniref:Uncharacterized protein LOC114864507 n=1 Tax=Betta splendens TaxID=158456 RepID=A0A6P7NMQ0_BETSP|nr:uncharacterized protein LOC114864507 [Betta splendens]XP_029021202.1 uncharacterized protein LOC114864507 [Betta splendens]